MDYSLHGPDWYQGSGISVLQDPTEELVQELVQDFISVLLGPTEELVQELVPEAWEWVQELVQELVQDLVQDLY